MPEVSLVWGTADGVAACRKMESSYSLAVGVVSVFAKQTANLRDQRLGIARLHHHGIKAGCTRQIELLDVGISGRGDERYRPCIRARLEIPSHLVPGFSREFEVHDDDVGFLTHRFGECALAVGRGQDVEPFSAEIDSPHVERVGVVVDDEETGS